eukprot:2829113-Prymnesium_polylepis.1
MAHGHGSLLRSCVAEGSARLRVCWRALYSRTRARVRTGRAQRESDPLDAALAESVHGIFVSK